MTIDRSWGSSHLERSEIFRQELKMRQEHPTMAQKWVNWIGDIPGDSIRTTLKVNSIGALGIDTWTEGKALPERRMDSGQFTFNIDKFVGNKVALTDHFFETSFQANQVLSQVVPEMKLAHDKYMETEFLKTVNSGQTSNNANNINGAPHRFVGSGDGSTAPTDTITLSDISWAAHSLNKAAAPVQGRIAIVDSLTAHNLGVKANLVDVSNNPMWEGIITTGMLDGTGLRFVRNIYGFDVYVSEYLPTLSADEASLVDRLGAAPATADITGFVANYFMVVGGDRSPVIGAMGRQPKIVSWRDEDVETEYHQMTQSFGFGLYRPENVVTILTNPSGIA